MLVENLVRMDLFGLYEEVGCGLLISVVKSVTTPMPMHDFAKTVLLTPAMGVSTGRIIGLGGGEVIRQPFLVV